MYRFLAYYYCYHYYGYNERKTRRKCARRVCWLHVSDRLSSFSSKYIFATQLVSFFSFLFFYVLSVCDDEMYRSPSFLFCFVRWERTWERERLISLAQQTYVFFFVLKPLLLSVDDGIHRSERMSGRFRILAGIHVFLGGPSAFFSSLL